MAAVWNGYVLFRHANADQGVTVLNGQILQHAFLAMLGVCPDTSFDLEITEPMR